MELLMWLELIAVWRIEREHSSPKQDAIEQSQDEELPVASYPEG